jgi:hypothetical protein
VKHGRSAPLAAAPSWHNSWLPLGIVGLGVSIGPLATAVHIAFPAIPTAFAVPLPTMQWVIICYVLTYASLLLGCRRLGDLVAKLIEHRCAKDRLELMSNSAKPCLKFSPRSVDTDDAS